MQDASIEGVYQYDKNQLRTNRRDTAKFDRTSQMELVLYGLENQTEISNIMPVRTMGYDFVSYQRQIDKIKGENGKRGKQAFSKEIHSDQKLYPVITLVLYFGMEPWKTPIWLWDILQFPHGRKDELLPFISQHKINLVPVAWLSKEVRSRFRSDFQIVADFFAAKREKRKADIFKDKRKIKYIEAFLSFLQTYTSDKRYEKLRMDFADHSRKGENVRMCTVMDLLEDKIKEESALAMEQGMKQGMEQGIAVMISSYLADGFSKELILKGLVHYFSLTEKQAEEYYNQFTKIQEDCHDSALS